jgi:hypothetical protein
MHCLAKAAFYLLPLSVVAGLSGASRAATVTATLTGLTPYVFPTVSLDGSSITGGTGAIGWQGQAGNAMGLNGSFDTFCIDLIQDIYFGSTYTFNTMSVANAPQPGAYPTGGGTGPMGATKASELNTLYAEQWTNLTTDDELEAFQLAIWNIVYDDDASVTTPDGAFYVVSGFTQSIVDIANSYLVAAVDGPQKTFAGTLVALVGQSGAQDQIYASEVPLPRTILGGGILLGACMLVRRKQRVPGLS